MERLFNISPFSASLEKQLPDFLSEPHAHDMEELVISLQGKIEHFINFKSTIYNAPLISYVTKGKSHRITFLHDNELNYPQGWIFRFKSEFIPESRFQLYAGYHEYATIELAENKHFTQIVKLCEIMYEIASQEVPDYAILRSLLSSLFIMIESERKKSASMKMDQSCSQHITFRTFLQILEDNFRRDVNVDFYAEKLNMSSRNLNIICQNILQKSVSEIIETRKLTEAKELLMNSEKTIAEIGFELGYNEKSYFSNVFKKKAGVTPSEFRNEMSKLIS